MKMSDARDELARLLEAGHPDAELIITVPTDTGHSFFTLRRLSMTPPELVKPKQVRLVSGLAEKASLLYVQG